MFRSFSHPSLCVCPSRSLSFSLFPLFPFPFTGVCTRSFSLPSFCVCPSFSHYFPSSLFPFAGAMAQMPGGGGGGGGGNAPTNTRKNSREGTRSGTLGKRGKASLHTQQQQQQQQQQQHLQQQQQPPIVSFSNGNTSTGKDPTSACYYVRFCFYNCLIVSRFHQCWFDSTNLQKQTLTAKWQKDRVTV